MEISPDIRWYDCLDSTNDEARRQIDTLDSMSVLAARRQTAGRGQGDHKWHSVEGQNLTFTVVLRFGKGSPLSPLAARDSLVITQITTLALRRFLLSLGIECRIKWPNDIYVGGGKICGILIENILSGKYVRHSIIGIGLNVNQTVFPDDIPNPESISRLTGNQYDLERMLETFCKYMCQTALQSCTPEGRAGLAQEFNQYMFRLEGDTRGL